MRQYENKWWAAIGICLGVFVVAMDWSIVNAALPSIQKDFRCSTLALQWMMNSFGLFLCTLLVTMGRVADVFGRRKLFFIGLLTFGFSSLLAGFALNAGWLIVWRAFQGIATAILLPISQALVSLSFPEKERNKALSIWTTIVSCGLAIGPVIGGVIISTINWRWIFFLNVPISIICSLMLFSFVKESKNEQSPPHIDWKGCLLLFLGIAALIIAILQGPEWGWNSVYSYLGFILGAFFLVFMLIRERKEKTPLIRLSLFTHRVFLSASLANTTMIFLAWAAFFILPLYMQGMRLDSPLQLGGLLIFLTAPVIFLSPFFGRTHKKIGEKNQICMGLSLLAVALYLFAFFNPQTMWPYVALSFFLFGLGWAMMWSTSMTAALSTLSSHEVGSGVGAFTTVQEIGGSLGLAITGTIFRYIDAVSLNQILQSSNVSLSISQQQEVKSLLSDPENAKQIISTLGEKTSSLEILTFFQQSFMKGFSHAIWFLFCLVVAVLILTLLIWRNKKS